MATFKYRAIGPKGALVNDSINAESPRHARQLLKQQGIVALQLDEIQASATRSLLSRFSGSISHMALAMLLRQLATLIASGLPIDETLRLMASQSDDARQKRLLQSWMGSVSEGVSLSRAMQQGSPALPERIVAAVAVAEEVGHLDAVLDRLASDQERSLDNRKTLNGALIYPALLISIATAVLVFVMVNVVPKITSIFISQKTELPPVTQAVIAASNFLSSYGILVLLVMAGLVGGFIWRLQDPSRRLKWHTQLLQLPKLGYWLKLAVLSDWCRSMSLLLSSQVPVVNAMQIANAGVGNLCVRDRLDRVSRRVQEGESLHAALSEHPEFPGFMLHLIGSGEAGSNLVPMLQRVADYYSAILKSGIDTLLKLLNPLLLILIAGVIMVIILGVLTPIMQMNQMV
ncbi:type II secretion system F family protein [Marinobacterium sp. YM272]|uniref:type II secretion system F family protein n=1 Tax=Marinobacterium sp. YM272 TaxID=3421654 RepID=UPI003D7F56EE